MANKPILETFKDTNDEQHMMFHQQTVTSPIDTTDRNQQMSVAEQLSVAQNDFDVPLNKSKKVLRQIQSGYDKVHLYICVLSRRDLRTIDSKVSMRGDNPSENGLDDGDNKY
eukprot:393081_1